MERLEIIEALKHVPASVQEETAGVSENVLRSRPAEGEWSIKEIAGHLRDMAEVWHKRLNAVYGLTDPLFPGFDGEASVRDNAYQEADVAALVAEMLEWRLKTVNLLSHAVDWTRLGSHQEIGRRSLKQWGEYMVEHETSHVEDIRRMKAAGSA